MLSFGGCSLKRVDKKLKELGYEKMFEDTHGVSYRRTQEGFVQVVDILKKRDCAAILQSYCPDLFDSKSVGNTCVGLTYLELKLFSKKMKQLKLCRI